MFNRDDWNSSLRKLKSTRTLAILAIMIAIKVVLAAFYIPVAENLRVSIRFIPVALEALMFGPAASMISAVITDLLGFFLFPSGPFFPGYTLSAAVQSLLYAGFLYNRQLSVKRVFLAQLLNNVIVNITLNSLWSKILYSRGYWYYLVNSLIKNVILLPFETAALVCLLNLLMPYLIRKKLAVKQDHLPMKLL